MESFRETLVNASRGTNFQFPSITLSSYESLAPTTTDQLPLSLLSIDPREGRDVLILRRINLQEEAHVIHVISTSAQHNCSHFAFLPATKPQRRSRRSILPPPPPPPSPRTKFPKSQFRPSHVFSKRRGVRARTRKRRRCPPFFPVAGILAEFSRRREGRKKKERRKKIRNRIEKR